MASLARASKTDLLKVAEKLGVGSALSRESSKQSVLEVVREVLDTATCGPPDGGDPDGGNSGDDPDKNSDDDSSDNGVGEAEEIDDRMTIRVSGPQLVMDMLDTTPIDNIKAQIQYKEGIPTEQQRLSFDGDQLEEGGRTLSSYDIPDYARIDLTWVAQQQTKSSYSDSGGPGGGGRQQAGRSISGSGSGGRGGGSWEAPGCPSL